MSTIDPKEYDSDGKHYAWDVKPREFHVAGKSTVVCNATLCEDGVSEDTRRALFVPWVAIDVSNVVLHCPNPEKGWPYDPVYDDPIWGMTVRGDLSDAAAGNIDKAPVSYVLNKPAASVEIVPFKSKYLGLGREDHGDDFGQGVKIAGSVLAVAGLLPGGSIPSAILSLALTWSPSSTPKWLGEKCMVVMHGPWQMSMHIWEGGQYVVKDDVHHLPNGYTYGERGTFSVNHERGYKDGWYAWVCERGKMPVNDLNPSDVNSGLSAELLFDGFVSNCSWEQHVNTLGVAYYHSSQADGPNLGEGFFAERKVHAPWLKWEFEARNNN